MVLERRILIIGGTGFFGKSILSYINKNFKSSKIIILSRNVKALDEKHFPNINISKINTDICELEKIPDVDQIIYAATPTSKENYQKDGINIIKNVNQGIKSFGDLVRKDNFKGEILYTSSGAIYGPHSKLEKIAEDANIIDYAEFSFDKKIYAESKKYSENVIQDLAKDGFKVSIARCFAFIGSYLDLNAHFIIGNILNSIIENKKFTLVSTNRVYRSFMHTDDLSEWLLKILDISSNLCPIYNVGSDESYELRDLVRKFKKIYGLNYEIQNEILSDYTDWYVPSIEKIKSDLGCNIKINLDEAVKSFLNI